ncbi:hypothetical protein ACFQZI_10330 [Mucilaginibacter lutimaris]|uniref:YD repeat-containing protein n=1 Tax=Mucilaginibacter lutimaris TaxID=931629 RepID=A0ABW2ZG98_9SPHI
MKKISFLLILLLAILSFQSCTKDSIPAIPKTKTYLLKQIITDNRISETFTYDEKNRLKTWLIPEVFEYRFVYDAQDRLTEVQTYDIHVSLVTYVSRYTYEANKIHITKKYDYQDTHTITKQTYELSNNKIVKKTYDDDPVYSYEYKYDSKGNLISSKEINKNNQSQNSETVFVYDDKKDPFSMVKGSNPFFFGPDGRSSGPNNLVESRTIGQEPYAHFTFQYNEDNLPVSMVADYRDFDDSNVTYEYIIK